MIVMMNDNDNDSDVAANSDDDDDDDKYAKLTSGQRWPSFPKYWTDSEALP